MDHFELRDGAIWCEEVPLSSIADAVGTPVYVYSTAAMVRQARLLSGAVAGCGNGDPLVAYAVKANPNPAVLTTLAARGPRRGRRFDRRISRSASAAGIAPERIVFSASARPRTRWPRRSTGGLLQFNVESVEEARTLSAVASSTRRGRAGGACGSIPTSTPARTPRSRPARPTTSSGSPPAPRSPRSRAARDLPGLEVTGMTVHIGSQLTSLAPLEAAFAQIGELLRELRAAGHDVRTGRPRRRAWRALRRWPAGTAKPGRIWRDGRAGDARLGRPADFRAGPADRRQCRRAADPRSSASSPARGIRG